MIESDAKKRHRESLSCAFKRRYVLAFVLIIAFLAITVFTTQGLSIFNNGVTMMNDLEFYLMVSASLLTGIGLLVLAFKNFKIKANRTLMVVCFVLLVIDIVAVLIFPSSINNEKYGFYWTYSITNNERIRYIFGWVVGDLALYIFVGVIPALFRSHRAIDFWLWVGIGVGLLLIIASFIKESDYWIGLFKGSYSPNGVCSLANNKNTFGFAVFWAFNCALILYSKYHRVPYLILIVFLALITGTIQCKTTIASVGIELMLTVIYFPIVGWKKRKKSQIIYLSIMACSAITITLIAFFPIKPLEGLSQVIKEMMKSIFSLSDGTMTGRTDIWERVFSNMVEHPTILLFGTGDGIFEWFVMASSPDHYMDGYLGIAGHNGFLYVWGRFGIIGVLVYLFGIGYLIYDAIHALKVRKDKWIGILLIVIFGFLAHSMAEDDALLDMRLKGMMFLGIIWWPLFISRRNWALKRGNVSPMPLEQAETTKRRDLSVLDVLKTSYTVSLFLLVLLVGLAPMYASAYGGVKFNNVYSLSGLTIICLLTPLLIAELKLKNDKRQPVGFTIIHWFVVFTVAVGIIVAFVSETIAYPISIGIVLLLLLFIGGSKQDSKGVGFKDIVPLIIKIVIGLAVVALAHSLCLYLDRSLITKTSIVAILCVYIGLVVLGFSFFPSLKDWNGALDVIGSKIESQYEKDDELLLDKADRRINLFC